MHLLTSAATILELILVQVRPHLSGFVDTRALRVSFWHESVGPQPGFSSQRCLGVGFNGPLCAPKLDHTRVRRPRSGAARPARRLSPRGGFGEEPRVPAG